MLSRRFFKRRFPRIHRTSRNAFLLSILLILGCGGEDFVHTPIVDSVGNENPIHDVLTSTPYYPMTLGSRWVYQNPDGSEWTREVANAGFLDAQQFAHSFSHNPVIEESTLDFSRAPLYIATPDRIVRPIKTGEIGTTARQEIDIPINQWC